jgi:hypothetical protein
MTRPLSKAQLQLFDSLLAVDPHVLLMKRLTAGKARFTLVSHKTGDRFTYEFRSAAMNREQNWTPMNQDRTLFFIKVLTAPDMYSYLGTMRGNHESMIYQFARSKASKIHASSPSYIAIQWFIHHVFVNGVMPCNVDLLFSSNCGRCGRELTVPESIKSGFGPECVGKI